MISNWDMKRILVNSASLTAKLVSISVHLTISDSISRVIWKFDSISSSIWNHKLLLSHRFWSKRRKKLFDEWLPDQACPWVKKYGWESLLNRPLFSSFTVSFRSLASSLANVSHFKYFWFPAFHYNLDYKKRCNSLVF